jgi:hypothetical protein
MHSISHDRVLFGLEVMSSKRGVMKLRKERKCIAEASHKYNGIDTGEDLQTGHAQTLLARSIKCRVDWKTHCSICSSTLEWCEAPLQEVT